VVDSSDGAARADCTRGRTEVIGPFRDRYPRSRCDGLDEQPRRLGIVHVNGNDIEPANDRGAEGKAEQRKGDDRHAEQQEARNRITQDPAHFARRDGIQSRARWRHERRSAQSV
jgi:hypothetical protein